MGPSFATFKSSLRARKAPFSSRHATMFFATAALTPATRCKSGAEAVFKSTPTLFTQCSTTPSSASARRAGGMSC